MMPRYIVSLILTCCVVGNVAWCSENTMSLQSLENYSPSHPNDTVILKSSPRNQAMGNVAFTLGAQSGYMKQMQAYEKVIIAHKQQLDHIFDFSTIVQLYAHDPQHRFLFPPVVERADKALDASQNGITLNIADRIYHILTPARLVSLMPTWEQYLLFDAHALHVNYPSSKLLPKNTDEKKFWKAQVKKGWQAGVLQAKTEMNQRIFRLKRDFIGIITYGILRQKQLINAPHILMQHQSVSGNTTNMRINQTQYRITTPAELNMNTKQWKTIPLNG